jgi:hypothetical protein
MPSVTNTFTDTIGYTYTGNGKSVAAPLGTYTGAKDAGVATVITAGATNTAIAITFPFATIQSFIMTSDQDITVKVNAATTPTETFAVKKTAPHVWATDFVGANPWAHDVTTLFVTNAGAVDAKFNLRVLFN